MELLIGLEVKADHPITCINPTETFLIKEVEIRGDRVLCRGEETCWFNWNMLTRVEK